MDSQILMRCQYTFLLVLAKVLIILHYDFAVVFL